MPRVEIHAPPTTNTSSHPNPLPSLLHTPAGLALIEIQGTLNVPEPAPNDPSRQQIGRLEFPLLSPDQDAPADSAWMKKVYFYVGDRQRLAGEVRELEKPLCVVRKRCGEDGGNGDLEVVDVVKWKIWFGSRPEFV